VWVDPVVSKHARRALLEAEAFLKLGLLEKAELVLAQAAQTEPRSVEIREEYRKVLGARSRHKEYIDETLALAALYVQRRYEQRALELLDELLESDPENAEAQVLLERLSD
jgi:Tfp pilus assembly protein PilF